MHFHFQQAFRALILLSFSILIYKLHYTGQIYKLINPKYEMLSQIAAFIFLILFFIQITRVWTVKQTEHVHDHSCSHTDSCRHDHGESPFNLKKAISYMIIVFPLLTGFILPPKTLDSSIAEKKGGMLILTKGKKAESSTNVEENASNETATEDETIGLAPQESDVPLDNPNQMSQDEFDQLMGQLETMQFIDMNDTVYASYYDKISLEADKYKGRTIKLKGFVYKEEGFQPNQLVISRFLISHCVADASIVGFLSEFEEAATLNKDTWIEAEGIIELTTYNGMELPLIKITEWKEIKEPNEPYLFPINVKIL